MLLIQADAGAACSDAGAEAMRQAVPSMEHVKVPGSGHSVHRTHFGPFMEALGSFLAKCGGPLADVGKEGPGAGKEVDPGTKQEDK